MTDFPTPKDVLDFWFSAGPQKWFAKDEGFDAEIATRFSALNQQARGGHMDEWAETPQGVLALIIVLDQFSRNLYRGSAETFAADEKALGLAKQAIKARVDTELPEASRIWIYMTFMHSENLEDQERCVEVFDTLEDKTNLAFAIDHRDIIKKFSRFPHRNAVLGRSSRPEELTFLSDGGFAG